MCSTSGIQQFTHKNWTFSLTKSTIANASQLSALKNHKLAQLPEMLFLDSKLLLEYSPSISIQFTALDALDHVKDSNDMQVATAATWQKTQNKDEIKDVIRPFDWTYTPTYTGTMPSTTLTTPSPKTLQINTKLLSKPDPILFYTHLILYEDELADNGTAILSVRCRVMKDCFLVLLRFMLRVDNLLVRVYDTRYYHEFGTHKVLKKWIGKECDYKQVLELIPNTQWQTKDLSLLHDENWVASTVEKHGSVVWDEGCEIVELGDNVDVSS